MVFLVASLNCSRRAFDSVMREEGMQLSIYRRKTEIVYNVNGSHVTVWVELDSHGPCIFSRLWSFMPPKTQKNFNITGQITDL